MKVDILIIGGGIPGLTLAAYAEQIGLQTGIVDPSLSVPKTIELSGRTAAIMHGPLNLIKTLGVWENIKDKCSALKTLRIIDDSIEGKQPTKIDFRAHEIGLEEFGFNVPQNVLRQALLKYLQATKDIRFFETTLHDFVVQDAFVQARTKDRKDIQAKLIIGADGKNSVTRNMAGIDAKEHDYGQRAITCLLNHTEAHDFISTEFHRSGGPFTLVPMPGKTSSLVWVEKEKDAQHFLRLDKADFVQALQQRSKNILGDITLKTKPESWPLKSVLAKTYIVPRVALMAEAAHAMSPIGAQGLNLSLRDVASLAEILKEAATNGEDIGKNSVLNRYETQRKADIETRVGGIHMLNLAVANHSKLLSLARQSGLNILKNVAPIKQFAMLRGLKPNFNDSRLLRGEAF